MNNSLITYLKNHIESLSGETFIVYGVNGKDVLEIAQESVSVFNWSDKRYMDTYEGFNKLSKFLKTFLP
jgi:hypothetical protein